MHMRDVTMRNDALHCRYTASLCSICTHGFLTCADALLRDIQLCLPFYNP